MKYVQKQAIVLDTDVHIHNSDPPSEKDSFSAATMWWAESLTDPFIQSSQLSCWGQAPLRESQPMIVKLQ